VVEKKSVESHRWKELLEMTDDEETWSTGYFRRSHSGAGNVTEITAAMYGANELFHDVELILDMGGQDIKVIEVEKNRFFINDKCSAGTGAFLSFAAGYLGVDVDKLSSLHFKGKQPVHLNNTCTVFALTEMISHLVDGAALENVVSGMHHAFARRITSLIPHGYDRISVIGGVANNMGVLDALSQCLDAELEVPDIPQFVNALGAAAFGLERGKK